MKSANKYISKLDYTGTRGYQVRLPSVKEGEFIQYQGKSRYFRRNQYLTWNDCLSAAVAWRNSELDKHNTRYLLKKKSAKNGRAMTESGLSCSGVIGVVLCVIVKPSGSYAIYKGQWSVTTKEKRMQKSRSFSIHLYGDCNAFKMACEVRYKAKGTIIITDSKIIPCLPDVPYEIRD